MDEDRVRVLSEADWGIVRDLRLEGLRESPESFVASYEEESQYDEHSWRERMRTAQWLVVERDGNAVGIVGLGLHEQEPKAGEIFGLWVAPQVRRSRVAWDLVLAGVEQARSGGCARLYFWVGSDNGPAVAFASAIGFRPTSERRPVRASDDVEVAMVASLGPDPTAVANPRIP